MNREPLGISVLPRRRRRRRTTVNASEWTILMDAHAWEAFVQAARRKRAMRSLVAKDAPERYPCCVFVHVEYDSDAQPSATAMFFYRDDAQALLAAAEMN